MNARQPTKTINRADTLNTMEKHHDTTPLHPHNSQHTPNVEKTTATTRARCTESLHAWMPIATIAQSTHQMHTKTAKLQGPVPKMVVTGPHKDAPDGMNSQMMGMRPATVRYHAAREHMHLYRKDTSEHTNPMTKYTREGVWQMIAGKMQQ
jgi:hypothetical protein